MASEKDKTVGLCSVPDFDAPVGWSPAAAYESAAAAHEAGLAILAMGQAYWLLPHEDIFIICVAEGKLPVVRHELEIMQKMGGKPELHTSAPTHPELSFGGWSFLAYTMVLSLFFAGQFFFPLLDAGRVDAVQMVEHGEWWRALTALTLHGDIVHLVSNIVAGLGFTFLLARFLGTGMAWLFVLLTGTVGNAWNAWIHYPEPHLSIGASTAVFGALGLITGTGLWVAMALPAERWTLPRWLLPAFGGLTLLGLLGLGDGLDGRVDVAAHISGFIFGSLAGFLSASRQKAFIRADRYSIWTGLSALALVLVAWLVALV